MSNVKDRRKARKPNARTASIRKEVERRCRRAKGYTLQLQCKAYGEKAWSVLRTLSAATNKERISAFSELSDQRDRWDLSGYFGLQEYRIQFI